MQESQNGPSPQPLNILQSGGEQSVNYQKEGIWLPESNKTLKNSEPLDGNISNFVALTLAPANAFIEFHSRAIRNFWQFYAPNTEASRVLQPTADIDSNRALLPSNHQFVELIQHASKVTNDLQEQFYRLIEQSVLVLSGQFQKSLETLHRSDGETAKQVGDLSEQNANDISKMQKTSVERNLQTTLKSDGQNASSSEDDSPEEPDLDDDYSGQQHSRMEPSHSYKKRH